MQVGFESFSRLRLPVTHSFAGWLADMLRWGRLLRVDEDDEDDEDDE